MRRYLETHPWITFRAIGINDLPPKTWMHLGEARAECRYLANVLLWPEVAAEMSELALVQGAQASTAIEGNTLSTEQVTGILRGEYSAPPSRAYQEREVRNVLDALLDIGEQVHRGERPTITADQICDYNRRVLEGTDQVVGVAPGAVRTHSVVVGGYRGAPAEDCAHLLERLAEWLEGDTFRSDDQEVQFALHIAAAVCAHLYIAWIHPFGDGNGRTARLLEFAILARSGMVPLLAAHLFSNHYNLTRDRYYRELDASSRRQSISEFVAYAVEGFVDGLREQVERVERQQVHIAWINYVNDTMNRFASSRTRDRQRLLALAIPPTGVISVQGVANLTPELAAGYARTAPRTLSRDLARLETLGLVVREPDGWRARIEVLAAFLPPAAAGGEDGRGAC